jgi:hypothetical protein
MRFRPLRGKGRRRLVGGVVHVKLLEPAGKTAADWPGKGSRPRSMTVAAVGA